MRLQTDNRWTAHPRLALAIRAAALLVPVGLSFLAALVSQRLFDRWFPGAPWILGALVSLVIAMVTLVVGERLGRRLLPLAMLLKLALLFPDQVPSRFSIAIRASSPKRLAAKLASGDLEEATAAERVLSLVTALSSHDRLTRGHSERVRAVSLMIADEMGIKGVERDKLEWAALLHDIGKVTVAPAILNKRGAPDDDEWASLRTHPAAGAPLAGDLVEWMGDWVHAIDQHHERFDGSGYPLGLEGDGIALSGRIVAVADAFEVMTAVRSYKQASSVADARTELAKCKGTHFDPVVVRSFTTLSVARLHRALGPTSWAMSLPFRGVAAQLARAASSLVGGSAPSVLAGLTAAVALSMATVAAADAVDGRFEGRTQVVVVETAAGADLAASPAPSTTDPDETTATADDTSADDESVADDGEPGTATETEADGDAPASDSSNGPTAAGTGETSENEGTDPAVALAVDLSTLDLAKLTPTELEQLSELLDVDVADLSDLSDLIAGALPSAPGTITNAAGLATVVANEATGALTTLLEDAGIEVHLVDNVVDGLDITTPAEVVDDLLTAADETVATIDDAVVIIGDTVDDVVNVPELTPIAEPVGDVGLPVGEIAVPAVTTDPLPTSQPVGSPIGDPLPSLPIPTAVPTSPVEVPAIGQATDSTPTQTVSVAPTPASTVVPAVPTAEPTALPTVPPIVEPIVEPIEELIDDDLPVGVGL